MTRIEAVLRRAVKDLSELGADFCIVGGIAVGVRCEPRFTRDVDVAVAVRGDAEAERLLHSLRLRGYEVLILLEQTRLKRLATARLIPPGEDEGGVILDLLFAASGIEEEVVDGAEAVRVFRGVKAKVASVAHLIAMKTLASKPVLRAQDFQDLALLLERATERDLRLVTRALRRIVERGFHRGVDLSSKLKRIRERLAPVAARPEIRERSPRGRRSRRRRKS